MSDRPILFGAPMIRALLEGRKTMTRRILKPQPPQGTKYNGIHYASNEPDSWFFNCPRGPFKTRVKYDEGDRLWVRETFQVYDCYETELGFELGYPIKGPLPKEELRSNAVVFRADDQDGPWRSPIHMPPRVVARLANHPRGLDRTGRVFRWSKCGELYSVANAVYKAAQIDDHGAPFHILRHTYGALMTRLGADLVATGVWKSPTAARVYQHFVVTEEARKADGLPGSGAIKNKP